MNLDPEGRLAIWIYVDSNGEIYESIDPDMCQCSSEFVFKLLSFISRGDL